MSKIEWDFRRECTDKFRPEYGHTYREIYESVLTDGLDILEIGTAHGGFVSFCKEQLSDIYYVGADSHHSTGYNELADDFYLGNAYCEEFIGWLEENEYNKLFDLVIDDGPHSVQTQMWSMKNLDKFISDDGVFICEDVKSMENARMISNCSPYPFQTRIWYGNDIDDRDREDNICVIVDRREESPLLQLDRCELVS